MACCKAGRQLEAFQTGCKQAYMMGDVSQVLQRVGCKQAYMVGDGSQVLQRGGCKKAYMMKVQWLL